MPLEYNVSSHPSMYLEPKGQGTVDVINDFSWTLSPKSSRKNVPYVELVEYQQNAGQLIASVLYFLRIYATTNSFDQLIQAPKDPGDIYRLKYIAEPTGFRYKMPYFAPKKSTRTTNFGYEDGQNPFSGAIELGEYASGVGERVKGGSTIRKMFSYAAEIGAGGEAIIGLANTLVPGKFQLEHPKSWTGTEEGEYTFTFDLFNTGSVNDVIQNRNLCYILTYQNSPARRNFALTDPTCIYSVSIPDVVDMPAAYISGLEITNLGNTRVVKSDGFNSGNGFIIPEAYRITITLTSLFMPTRNIMQGMDKGNKVTAIANVDFQALNEVLKAGVSNDFSQINDSVIDRIASSTQLSRDQISRGINQLYQYSSTFIGPPQSTP